MDGIDFTAECIEDATATSSDAEKQATSSDAEKQATSSDTEKQATSYDAEKIISAALDENGKRFYQVRWISYSWEAEESFADAEHMVKEFWEEYERLQKGGKRESLEIPKQKLMKQKEQQQQ